MITKYWIGENLNSFNRTDFNLIHEHGFLFRKNFFFIKWCPSYYVKIGKRTIYLDKATYEDFLKEFLPFNFKTVPNE